MRIHTLSADDQRELTWYWCQAEGEMGIRSASGPQLERLEACLVGAASHKAIDPMPDRGEKARVDALRIHGSLVRLRCVDGGERHQRVLFNIYGPPVTVTYGVRLGELAPIAHYTAAARELAERLQAEARLHHRDSTYEVLPRQALAARLHKEGHEFAETLVRQSERLLEESSRAYMKVRETHGGRVARRMRERDAEFNATRGAA